MNDIFFDSLLPWKGIVDRVQLLQLKDNYMNIRGPLGKMRFSRGYHLDGSRQLNTSQSIQNVVMVIRNHLMCLTYDNFFVQTN